MTWDLEALRKALQENDEAQGKALLDKLPQWPRLKAGGSQAVMVPKRRKGRAGGGPAPEKKES
jgi:hypothetical protein